LAKYWSPGPSCTGSALRSRYGSSPRSTRRISLTFRSARTLCCTPTPDVILVPTNAVVNNFAYHRRTRPRPPTQSRDWHSRHRFRGGRRWSNRGGVGRLVGDNEHQERLTRPSAGDGGAMKLVLITAWTHVRRRARQTLVAIAGVTTVAFPPRPDHLSQSIEC
jgi:hypothetical protein